MPSTPNFTQRRRRLLAGFGLLGGLGWTVGGPAAAQAAPVPWSPMLATDAPVGIDPADFLVSEKYDGVRALWDGGQLRFRCGLPVAAPHWFLAQLPRLPLDGELWLARGRFEALSGLVRRAQPDDAGWRAVRFMVFDLPRSASPFATRQRQLEAVAAGAAAPAWQLVEQQALADAAALRQRLQAVLRAGGEGLMLHRADATYSAGRSTALLKLKPVADAEAVVLRALAGRGRHVGRMGALQVRTEDGREFLLGTGFSDAQRERPPAPGSTVTYSHRGYTANGLPRFASFLRTRDTP